jgi:hypothetical protein
MKKIIGFSFLLLFVSCEKIKITDIDAVNFELNKLISLLEYDVQEIEKSMLELANFSEALFEDREKITAEREVLPIVKGISNASPNANPNYSTIYISTLTPDMQKAKEFVKITNPLDEKFSQLVNQNELISQVYYNNYLHINRLYPPYDAYSMTEPDLDLVEFNFYYLADSIHNPSKGSVWIEEPYIDPAGRGWLVSLLHPIYSDDQLQMVLGIDFTINDVLDKYLKLSSRELIILDNKGTVVAGKPNAIKLLSLPQIKNHTYTRPIVSDNLRMDEFNVLKSKSRAVRAISQDLLTGRKNNFIIQDSDQKIYINSKKMKSLNWFVLDIEAWSN